MIKLEKSATNNIIGINIYVGTLSFFVEKVGIRLTIKKETIQSNVAQKACERTIVYSGKSKEIITGRFGNDAGYDFFGNDAGCQKKS